MRNYTAEQIANLTAKELRKLPTGGLFITCKDGTVLKLKTTWVHDSWPYLQFQKRYHGCDIKPTHFFQTDICTAKSFNDMASAIFFDNIMPLFAINDEQTRKDFWPATDYLYQIINRVYNDSVFYQSQFAHTLDYLDFNEILMNPRILELKQLWMKGEISVEDCHDELMVMLESDDTFLDNNIKNSIKADILSRRQITQMFFRGVILDINGETFKTPIYPGYAEGLPTAYERAIETRNASLSLYMADRPLEKSEYYNRQAQLCCGIIQAPVIHDCGGKYTAKLLVTKVNFPELLGSYHMVNDEPVMIHNDMKKDLVGKIIKLRNINYCDNEDVATPCEICVGYAAIVTPPGTSLGLATTVKPLSAISQNIMGIKHVIASVQTLTISTEGPNAIYTRLDKDNKYKVRLVNIKQDTDVRIRFDIGDILFINDIAYAEDINDLIPSDVSAILKANIVTYNTNGETVSTNTINLEVGGKGSPLSREFLTHMKQTGWEFLTNKVVEVPLKGFDLTNPFVISPRRGENIMKILNDVDGFTSASKVVGRSSIKNFKSPIEATMELMAIFRTKAKLNIIHASVFVRALSVADVEGNDGLQLPHPSQPIRYESLRNVLLGRSAGLLMGYQRQTSQVNRPGMYLRDPKTIPHSDMDRLWDRD